MRRRARSGVLGAVLAIMAMFGLVALSGWHGAIVHDDGPAHLVAADHDHGSSRQADADGPIHLLAHATCQWIATGEALAAPLPGIVADHGWPGLAAAFRGGIDPSRLLRPPRG